MSLVEELMARGHRLRHEGSGNYRVMGHSGLIVKENYWFSHSAGKGGDATTLFEQIEPGYDGPDRPQPCYQSFENDDCDLEWKKGYQPLNTDAENYLLKRSIDLSLIRHQHMSSQRLLRYDGKGYLCFMGYDELGRVKCVSKRAIDSTLNVQRYEAKGSDKKYSFHMTSETPSNIVILVEGPIDALSVACLENLKHRKGYFQTHKIATCGAPASNIRQRILKLKCERIVLAFDRDEPGRAMTEMVAWELRHQNIKVVAPPKIGKDPNDWLRHRLKML